MSAENKYSIFLKGLRFHSPVGVLEQERIVGNDILVDISLEYPFRKAMETDDIGDTLNYASVFNIIKEEAAKPVKLLEKPAGNISAHLFATFPGIGSMDIRITKSNPPMGADSDGAGIEIHLINPKTEG